MKMRRLAANQTEVSFVGGPIVFFSYDTPVASQLPSGRYVRTSEYYSPTTTRHINGWLRGITNVEVVDQDFIDLLVGLTHE